MARISTAATGSGRARKTAKHVLFTLAMGVSVPALLAAGPAVAQEQQAQSARSHSFNIPAKPLPQAIADLSSVTGLQVLYTAQQPFDLTSRPVVGSYTAPDALTLMLAGTGISWRFTGANAVILGAAASDGASSSTLPTVTVEGEASRETAWGPAGYIATRSASGTKTDTPLIETPQSISVVTREQMEARGVESIGQALRYAPGVSAEPYGIDTREGGLRMRGFDMSDGGFFRDGMQLKVSGFANFPLEPYGAERLEALRGPSSVLYGQSSPGGMLNYVTKRPTETPLREITLGAGSFDRLEGKFDLGGPLNEDGTILYRVTGLARDGETQVDFVDHDRLFIAPAITFKPDANTSLTLLSHFQQDTGGWGIQFLPAAGTVLDNPNGKIPVNRFIGEPNFDQYDLQQYSIGYMFEHSPDDIWTLRQNVRFHHLDNQQKVVYGGSLQPDMRTMDRWADTGDSALDGFLMDNQAQAEFVTGPLSHTMLFGLDYQNNVYNDYGRGYTVTPIDIFNPVYGAAPVPGALHTDAHVRQEQIGLYVQDQIKFDERWVLVAGGRQDWAETDTQERLGGTSSGQNDNAMTGRVGLVYLSDMGLSPYVSYAESFVPALGVDVNGQPLTPETGRQYEIGVKYQPKGKNSFVGVSLYDLARQNHVTYDPITGDATQTGETQARGVEFEALLQPIDGLDLVAAYAWQPKFEVTKSADPDEVGKRPYGAAEHMASLWADYTFPRGELRGFGFGGGVRYIGKTEGDSYNTFQVPDVTLFDASIHYNYEGYRFAVNASNLFDKEYVAACQTTFAHCYYGASRTVLATVTYNW